MDASKDCFGIDISTIGRRSYKVDAHWVVGIFQAPVVIVHFTGWKMLAIHVILDWAKGLDANLCGEVDYMSHTAKELL